MTFIQPTRRGNILNLMLTMLVVFILGSTFALVALYNQVVNLNHDITATRADFDAVGSQNTKLSNQVITMLGNDDQLTNVANADGLVTDNKPQYVEATQ